MITEIIFLIIVAFQIQGEIPKDLSTPNQPQPRPTYQPPPPMQSSSFAENVVTQSAPSNTYFPTLSSYGLSNRGPAFYIPNEGQNSFERTGYLFAISFCLM